MTERGSNDLCHAAALITFILTPLTFTLGSAGAGDTAPGAAAGLRHDTSLAILRKVKKLLVRLRWPPDHFLIFQSNDDGAAERGRDLRSAAQRRKTVFFVPHPRASSGAAGRGFVS